MNAEYALYIITPFIVGFIVERYKNMSTGLFAVLIFLFFVLFKVSLFLFFGDNVLPDLFEVIIGLSALSSTRLIFYIQKKLRMKVKS